MYSIQYAWSFEKGSVVVLRNWNRAGPGWVHDNDNATRCWGFCGTCINTMNFKISVSRKQICHNENIATRQKSNIFVTFKHYHVVATDVAVAQLSCTGIYNILTLYNSDLGNTLSIDQFRLHRFIMRICFVVGV